MSSRAARGGDSSSEHYGGQTAAESSQSVCLDAASSVANAAPARDTAMTSALTESASRCRRLRICSSCRGPLRRILIQMSIPLTSTTLGMSEHLRHDVKRLSRVHEVRGAAMPEVVHADVRQPGRAPRRVPRVEDRRVGLSDLRVRDHERAIRPPRHRLQLLDRRRRERHAPTPARLRHRHGPGAVLQVDVLPVPVEKLALARAGVEEQRHDVLQLSVRAWPRRCP